MPGKEVTTAEYAGMLACFLAGQNFSEIGRAFRRHPSTVRNYALENNWKALKAKARRKAAVQAQTSATDELAEILKIQRSLRNAIWNKIAKRIGKDGTGPLGIPASEEIQTLLQTMRDQLKTLGVDEPGGGGTIHSERTLVFLNLPEKTQREIERKLLEDLGMVDPSELEEAEIVEGE